MKAAEVNDYFRRIRKNSKAWGGSLEHIEISNYKEINKLELNFPLSLSALVGANGSGKSRTLSAIYDALSDSSVAGLSVTLGEQHTEGGKPLLINASHKTELYKEYFRRLPDIEEDLLNGIAPSTVDGADLKNINYILCRSYEHVEFYETEPGLKIIDSASEDNAYSSDTVPYFVVSERGTKWDTRSMGAGEYAALYLWWALTRCDNQQKVLIEEPETFLSYAVQERFSNFLAMIAWEKKLNVFLSTHSYPIIARLPDESVKALVRSRSGPKLSARGKVDILSQIGAPLSLVYVCIVEDELAKFFVEIFLERYFPICKPKTSIHYMKGVGRNPKSGASGIKTLLEVITHLNSTPVKFIGLYDGDQSKEATFNALEIKDCAKGLLPGVVPLDEVFRDLCDSNIAEFAVVHPDFETAFTYAEGANFHDHLRSTCSSLNIPLETAWRHCFDIWSRENAEAVEEFKVTISDLLGAS